MITATSFRIGRFEVAMGAYNDALGNTTRAVFSACGPMLALSAAISLSGYAEPVRAADNPGQGRNLQVE